MPGYDKSRFVGLSQSEEEEFTCGICLAIMKEPAVVPCCRQTYCFDCIREWLSSQKSCPNDRHRLNAAQLYDPQRLVLNLLAKLRIHCLYHSNGCQTVSDIASMTTHEDNCQLNPNRKCSDCGIKVSESHHNCVNSLKLLNTSLAEEMLELESEIVRLKSEIKSLKEKNGNNNIQYDHINQVMASARTRICYPEITYCSISSAFRNKAITKSKEAILAFDSYSQISEFLNLEFNSDQNNSNGIEKKWYTISHSLECGESLIRSQNGYIDLRFGQLRIAIFSAGVQLESSLRTTSIMMNSSANNI